LYRFTFFRVGSIVSLRVKEFANQVKISSGRARAYRIVAPLSTDNICPVVIAASSEAR
jgi:hypothetical protein